MQSLSQKKLSKMTVFILIFNDLTTNQKYLDRISCF